MGGRRRERERETEAKGVSRIGKGSSQTKIEDFSGFFFFFFLRLTAAARSVIAPSRDFVPCWREAARTTARLR